MQIRSKRLAKTVQTCVVLSIEYSDLKCKCLFFIIVGVYFRYKLRFTVRRILVIASLVLVLSLFAAPRPTVSAHQSGCHRWHSCPSDTGSYVCGDLGYYSECGTSYYDEPDYTQQGTDNGEAHVDKNHDYIVQTATKEATDEAIEDGSSGNTSNPDPDTSICDDVTFSAPQPQEYEDAFREAFSDGCIDLYETTYNDTYDSAYETDYAAYEERTQNDDDKSAVNLDVSNTSEKSSTADNIFWFIVLAGGGAALIRHYRKK
jgi:hypothetical protein